MIPNKIRGRGANRDIPNRFRDKHVEYDVDTETGEIPETKTQFFRDHSGSIITKNDSPDISFCYSLNPYRGCEHGCMYCYARPTHEYLGYSPGLDFESKIVVKFDAPALLRSELASSSWKPEVLVMSGVTDCYQPAERRFRITRKCIKVLSEFRNPVTVISKNYLVTRDIDLLQQLAAYNACRVFISVTTLDQSLAASMEPRTSRPKRRLKAIRKLSEAGIPAGVMVAPVIPGLNDHEIPGILERAKAEGAEYAGYVLLRLPFAVKNIFKEWLHNHCPEKADKIINRIASLRGGKLNSAEFGARMTGKGPFADQISQMFRIQTEKLGLNNKSKSLSTQYFRRGGSDQLELF